MDQALNLLQFFPPFLGAIYAGLVSYEARERPLVAAFHGLVALLLLAAAVHRIAS